MCFLPSRSMEGLAQIEPTLRVSSHLEGLDESPQQGPDPFPARQQLHQPHHAEEPEEGDGDPGVVLGVLQPLQAIWSGKGGGKQEEWECSRRTGSKTHTHTRSHARTHARTRAQLLTETFASDKIPSNSTKIWERVGRSCTCFLRLLGGKNMTRQQKDLRDKCGWCPRV